ncbi:hypothetical protein E2C01_098276 [Portunus trituberculatus]|uniref:Uncharacterized protein n=1 Tax=Portunus trituberculatus TaxID=210409 RepID=A0A5B7K6N2_PORTR|nr:hypothetical protein [Portunus trituberculatus]
MLTTDVPSTFRRGLTVTAYAPEKLQSLNAWDYYVAFVNVKCEVIEQIEQTMTWQILFPTTTPTSLPTNAPIVGE